MGFDLGLTQLSAQSKAYGVQFWGLQTAGVLVKVGGPRLP